MNEELQRENAQIIIRNDTVEETLKKTTDALEKIRDNVEVIEKYLSSQESKITNLHAKRLIFRTRASILDLKIKMAQINDRILKENNKENTKLYEPLWREQETEEPEPRLPEDYEST